ncbi:MULTISPECIES: hypothetical protein [Halopenitus]|uniref:N-acetyltransferase domain-containing protein n=1 Tax=Halopenitus malekzadehii TaxID=1267564 RepID=A0A1H6IPK9_9EURY|nr:MULTISPECIES: hypothetical protein [Halopenitus]SEH50684.1 hypothetical protein SAMN05192561_103261 [Halopenitus malekzadehii]
MRVRDAVEADAEAIAALSGQPVDATREVIHDRSVRVAVSEGESDDRPDAGSAPGEPIAYVAFDARRGTVHLTGFDGEATALERLLEEPCRFADREGMAVEAIVDRDDETRRSIVEGAGFEEGGSGPRFDGAETVRYRLPVRE